MKLVLLSADNTSSVYSVPDKVAKNLRGYCNRFDKWLWTSKNAEKYRISFPPIKGRKNIAVYYTEEDFVEYLNKWVFRKEPTVLIEHLPNVEHRDELPEKYKDLEWYNF